MQIPNKTHLSKQRNRCQLINFRNTCVFCYFQSNRGPLRKSSGMVPPFVLTKITLTFADARWLTYAALKLLKDNLFCHFLKEAVSLVLEEIKPYLKGICLLTTWSSRPEIETQIWAVKVYDSYYERPVIIFQDRIIRDWVDLHCRYIRLQGEFLNIKWTLNGTSLIDFTLI